ncbi:hypothetical protein IWX50DRAFT_65989 [Phyllosticta citricarpa]|uniref:Uncharacterized protein n=1 Tax=Phyllosticta citricarpa TaxID=55181 RepID=A0ABR1MI56_9PEZI
MQAACSHSPFAWGVGVGRANSLRMACSDMPCTIYSVQSIIKQWSYLTLHLTPHLTPTIPSLAALARSLARQPVSTVMHASVWYPLPNTNTDRLPCDAQATRKSKSTTRNQCQRRGPCIHGIQYSCPLFFFHLCHRRRRRRPSHLGTHLPTTTTTYSPTPQNIRCTRPTGLLCLTSPHLPTYLPLLAHPPTYPTKTHART